MNEESSDEMRPEYDIRGGVRGKYYERSRVAPRLELPDSPLIAKSTATGSDIGYISTTIAWPHHAAKLTEEDVRRIRASHLNRRTLAAIFGVRPWYINQLRRTGWEHV